MQTGSVFKTVLVSLAASAPVLLFGQGDEELKELEEFIVADVPIEESILPTTRPFDSVYGTGRNIMETPRNVTIISREQLDAISIYDVRDFVKLTASSFTRSNFGAPSNPSIRTQTADTFVNGLRRGLTSNGNGLPVNFNAVESVNIVKGGPTAIYGASQYTGGYSDQITKKPYFDAAHGTAQFTIGMYDQYRWTVDYGTPISDQLAIRISYSGDESGSYYEYGKKETQAFYGALTWKPNDTYRMEMNVEFFNASYTENWGINRITQDLIDNGMYLPGTITAIGANQFDDGFDVDGNEILIDSGFDLMDRNRDGVVDLHDVRGADNYIEFGAPVKIDRRKRLLAPGDDSQGRQFTIQVIQNWNISERFSINNNTGYNWIDRNTFSSYGYSEVLVDNVAFDNRTEFRVNLSNTESLTANVNAGLHFRTQDVLAINHYFNEPANAHDLTLPVPSLAEARAGGSITRRISNDAFAFDNVIPGEPKRGILDARYGNAGFNGDSGDSKATRYGPFAQLDLQFGEHLGLFAGYRIDFMDIKYNDPFAGNEFARTSTSQEMENYNASVLYRFDETKSAYLTYNFSESASAGTGGGFVPSDWGGVGFADDNFHNENYLYEGGMKFSLKDQALFIGTAIFYQEFASPSVNALGEGIGEFDRIRLKGFEIEMNYQPRKSFYMTMGYSYIDATTAAGLFVSSALPVDRQPITNRAGESLERVKVTGNPDHLINFLAHYQMDSGIYVNLGMVITSDVNTGIDGACHEFANFGTVLQCKSPVVPWQYTVDLTLGYTAEKWEVKVDLFNLTDQENWSPPHRVYGNGSLLAELPFRAELTVKYNW